MNTNSNYYYGNQGIYQQATTSTTVAYQAPFDANQMQYGNMNHFQDFYNPSSYYDQRVLMPVNQCSTAQPSFDQTQYDPYGYWDANGYHYYHQAQAQFHRVQCPQQVQQPQTQQGHQAAPQASLQHCNSTATLQQRPQQQGYHHQVAPQVPCNVPNTSNSIPDPLFTPSLPPYVRPFMMASQSTIKVALRNQELWQMFHKLGNEMAVNNIGKELFPQLSYKVSGLNKGRQYKFVLWLERIDTFGFNWDRKLKQFKRKIQTGQEWENGKIDFSDVNLHNIGEKEKIERATKNGPMTESQLKTAQKKTNKLTKPRICVSLNCKYIPVLAIYEVTNGVCIRRGDFRFEETSFVVVSQYKNPVICAHKTALNSSNSKTKRAKAEMKLKEYSGEASRPDSAYSTGSDATPPPPASVFLGAFGSCPSTSSSY